MGVENAHMYTSIWNTIYGKIHCVGAFVPNRYKFSSGKWGSTGYL